MGGVTAALQDLPVAQFSEGTNQAIRRLAHTEAGRAVIARFVRRALDLTTEDPDARDQRDWLLGRAAAAVDWQASFEVGVDAHRFLWCAVLAEMPRPDALAGPQARLDHNRAQYDPADRLCARLLQGVMG